MSDLTSREALKEAIKNHYNLNDPPTLYWWTNIEKIIDNAPTVEAYTEEDMKQAIKENFDLGYETAKNKYERPQGEWKYEIIGDKSCVLCSICYLHFDNESNFCPNCGAKMKGGAE